jgi:hypothetical protein
LILATEVVFQRTVVPQLEFVFVPALGFLSERLAIARPNFPWARVRNGEAESESEVEDFWNEDQVQEVARLKVNLLRQSPYALTGLGDPDFRLIPPFPSRHSNEGKCLPVVGRSGMV